MTTVRLTTAQALFRYLEAQSTGRSDPILSGIWAIDGVNHCLVDAVASSGSNFDVHHGKSACGTALIASAFARQSMQQQVIAVLGPIEAEAEIEEGVALASSTGRPLLLLHCGSDCSDQTLAEKTELRKSAFRYCRRITNSDELREEMPRVMASLTGRAEAGAVKLVLGPACLMEFSDWPAAFFNGRVWPSAKCVPSQELVSRAAEALARAEAPILVAGDGALSGGLCNLLRDLVESLQIPVVETRGGRSALAWDHPLNLGPIGEAGSEAANRVLEAADVVLGFGRGALEQSHANSEATYICLDDMSKSPDTRETLPLMGDASEAVRALAEALVGRRFALPDPRLRSKWFEAVAPMVAAPAYANQLPNACQVIGAVQRSSDNNTIVLSAGGPLADNLHRLWKAARPGVCKLHFGSISTGCEIPLAIGTKMAEPEGDVICLMQADVYPAMAEELATAVANQVKITVVITSEGDAPMDIAADARSMGAISVHARSTAELEAGLAQARVATRAFVIVIDTAEAECPENQGLANAPAETHLLHREVAT